MIAAVKVAGKHLNALGSRFLIVVTGTDRSPYLTRQVNISSQFKELACKAVFDAGASGDAVACGILDEVYEQLAEFVGDVCCVLDPEVVVIGGGVSKAGKVLLEGIRARLHKYIFHAIREVELSLASLGNDAGAYGAFKLVVDAQK
jgi:predicted NBD/HSP70 family sugar kinase